MKKTVTQRALAFSAIAMAAGMAATSAHALDYDGYFRAGPGATKKDAARACYNLGGFLGQGGGHYRLGNECDFYGEFGLAQTGTVDGVTYKGKIMVNEYNGGTDTVGTGGSTGNADFEQMYVEAKGFDISPETNFWVGKRFYGRADIHIVDTFFTKMDGVGAGADNISIGGGAKLGLAYFGSDGGISGASKVPGQRFNVDVTSIPTNPGGTLRVTGTITNGNFTGGKGGFGLSLQHDQDVAGLGSNRIWAQYAQGSAGLNSNFDGLAQGSDVKQWRLIETFNWQAGPLGGQVMALFGQKKTDLTKDTGATVGGRVSYAITKNFKMVGEAGYMQNKPEGGATQKLAKLTIAPTLSTGPGYWNRPELRFYVTTAKWNAAANAAGGVGGLTGIGDGKTNGTSYGFQAEIWW